MMESSRAEGSSPLATVEDIRRRLIRPTSLLSPPPVSAIRSQDDVGSRDSSQCKVNMVEFDEIKKEAKDKREVTNRKLEDYLDPVLLSATSSKINRKRKENGEEKLKKEIKNFEWPVDELKVFMEKSRTEKKGDWRSIGAVDLNDDRDLMIKDVEAEEDEFCTPSWRFEKRALKLFKG